MRGAKPLSLEEIRRIRITFPQIASKPVALRTEAIFMLALGTGFRRAEVISLKIGQIWQHGEFSGFVYIRKGQTKGKSSGAIQPIPEEVATILSHWVEYCGVNLRDPESALFPCHRSTCSNKADFDFTRSINVNAYQKVFKRAVDKAELLGSVRTHSCRKTFGMTVYRSTGNNVLAAKAALRHHSLASTLSYLSVGEDEVQQAIRDVFKNLRQDSISG